MPICSLSKHSLLPSLTVLYIYTLQIGCKYLFYLKFIYSEKAIKFWEISTLLLFYIVPVKSKVEISQIFVAFSEYMNFIESKNQRREKYCVAGGSKILKNHPHAKRGDFFISRIFLWIWVFTIYRAFLHYYHL